MEKGVAPLTLEELLAGKVQQGSVMRARDRQESRNMMEFTRVVDKKHGEGVNYRGPDPEDVWAQMKADAAMGRRRGDLR